MPYYAGDFYVGDPGLFSFVKKAVGAVGKAVASPLGGLALGLIPGGGLVKTGLGLLGGLGGLAGSGRGAETGGTPGAVAAGASMVADVVRGSRARLRRVRRARRRRR